MPLPRKPQGVVFDMDGLLLDTEVAHRDVVLATAADFGFELPDDFFPRLIGLPSHVGKRVWLDELGHDADIEGLLTEARRRFYARVADGDLLKPGVVELLDLIGDLGLPHAIATSSGHDNVSHHLSAHGLSDRFPIVIADGDYARGKPSPDPYLTAAARLQLAPEACLALEDSHNGVRAAASAGMMTVMVPDLLTPTDEMRALCVDVVRDLNDIRALLAAA